MAITEKVTLCKQCGQDVGDSNFCPHCGAKVEREEILRFEEVATKPTTGKKKSLGKVGLIVLGVAAVCVLLALLGHLFSGKDSVPRETPFAAEPSPSQPSESTFSEQSSALPNTEENGYADCLRVDDSPYEVSFNTTLGQFIDRWNSYIESDGDSDFGTTAVSAMYGWNESRVVHKEDAPMNGLDTYSLVMGMSGDCILNVIVYNNYVVETNLVVSKIKCTLEPKFVEHYLNNAMCATGISDMSVNELDDSGHSWQQGILFFANETSNGNGVAQGCLSITQSAYEKLLNGTLTEEFSASSSGSSNSSLAIETLENNSYFNGSGEATMKELLDDMFLDPTYSAAENQDGSVTVIVTGNYRYARNMGYSLSGNLVLTFGDGSDTIRIEDCSIDIDTLTAYSDEYIADMGLGGGNDTAMEAPGDLPESLPSAPVPEPASTPAPTIAPTPIPEPDSSSAPVQTVTPTPDDGRRTIPAADAKNALFWWYWEDDAGNSDRFLNIVLNMFYSPTFSGIENGDGTTSITVSGNYRLVPQSEDYPYSGTLSLVLDDATGNILFSGESDITEAQFDQYFQAK